MCQSIPRYSMQAPNGERHAQRIKLKKDCRNERAQGETAPDTERPQAGQASGSASPGRDQTTDPFCLSLLGAQLSSTRSVPKTVHRDVSPQIPNPDSNVKDPSVTGSTTRTGNRTQVGPISVSENDGRGSTQLKPRAVSKPPRTQRVRTPNEPIH